MFVGIVSLFEISSKIIVSHLTILFELIASLVIEIIQLIIGRVFDIDDIILNVIGGMIGFYFYDFIYDFKEKLPNFLKKNYIYDIVVIILVGLLTYYLINIVRIGG